MSARWVAAVAVDLAALIPLRRRKSPPARFDAHVLPQWPVSCTVHGLQYASNLEPGCGCGTGGAR